MTRAPLALLLLLAACAPSAPVDKAVPPLGLAEIAPDAAGRCWGTDTQPAVIQTVTMTEQASPAVTGPDGALVAPATYRTATRHQIARERVSVAFETPCPPAYTPQFVESLQRALSARGFYDGAADGVLDADVGRAIQDFQREAGPDSPLLSMASARRLGLVTLTADQIDSL